jgi:hypothetical protein
MYKLLPFFKFPFIQQHNYTLLILLMLSLNVKAQDVVKIDDRVDQHIFSYGEITCLEDPAGKLTFNQVTSPQYSVKFIQSSTSTPQNFNIKSAYWYKVTIKDTVKSHKRWIIEFFDQTIDDITAWLPQENGTYQSAQFGALYKFKNRQFHHKNFEINLTINPGKEYTYYFRIKSQRTADVILVLRSVSWFIQYALNEYLLFGLFYGMLLIFAFYNLLIFVAVRQRQYLYYVLYNLSVGFYELCTDGIAYQYIWPNSPYWNEYAFAVALCCLSVFTLLFTSSLLHVKSKAPKLYRLINGVIITRIAFFFICFIFNKQLFNYKLIEFIPLIIAFYTGIIILKKGYRPARFFVLGYSFLFLGFILKFLLMLGISWLNVGVIGYYSLSICFILEMCFLAFALADKVRLLKKKKNKAQKKIIKQLIANKELSEIVNTKLEEQVGERTRELLEKTNIIEQKNNELNKTNLLLQEQTLEISRMNLLLKRDNIDLLTNVEKVTRARVMSADVDFEEFSKIYPDRDSCLKFLSTIKWNEDYDCHKCGNKHYFHGHAPYSRRCSKCSYEESVTAYTVFQNTRIPINKAFYMTFLIYSSKGKISSHQLSEILSIRQSTCWAFSSRIKKLLSDKKKIIKGAGSDGWSKIIVNYEEHFTATV